MQNKKLAWSLLIILSIVWGSSFILMKRGLDSFTSDEVAALRISIAFLFLAPLAVKYRIVEFKKYFPGLILMGVFGNLLPAFLFTKAETQISSSLTGMLNALTPLFTVLVGLVWLKVKPKPMQVAGIVIGFVGATCLMYFDSDSGNSGNLIYGLLVLTATFFYAISISGIKKYLSNLNSITATVWSFCITGPIALVYLLVFSEFKSHFYASPLALQSFGFICILAVIGSALSVIAYNILIKNSGTVFASSCTYLIPIVAIGWGTFDGENVNFYQILSIVVIILSVYLINRD